MYRGSTAFIISNGPSLKELDLSLLHKPGIVTYGVNNGPKTFRPNIWSCVDDPQRFLKSIWLDPSIQKIVPVDHFERFIFDSEKWETMKTRVGDCPNVIGFKRNEKFMSGRWLWEDSFNWGNHADYGGGRTISLPVMRTCFLLGFRKVYLLGVDLNMSEENTYHFDEQRDRGAVKGNLSTYKKMNEEFFPALKPEFEEAGFEVFNCNPKSGLTVFPYVSFEEAIKDATHKLGDTVNERVYGMYAKPKDKGKMKIEPPDEQKKNRTKEMKEREVLETAFPDEQVAYPQPDKIPTQAPLQKKAPKIIPNIPEMKPLPQEEQIVQLRQELQQEIKENVVQRVTPKETPSAVIVNNPLATSTLGKKK